VHITHILTFLTFCANRRPGAQEGHLSVRNVEECAGISGISDIKCAKSSRKDLKTGGYGKPTWRVKKAAIYLEESGMVKTVRTAQSPAPGRLILVFLSPSARFDPFLEVLRGPPNHLRTLCRK